MFTIPSLADLRDYSQDVLGEAWTYRCSLASLVRGLLPFAQRAIGHSSLDLQALGRLPMGELLSRKEAGARVDLYNALEDMDRGRVRQCWLGLS
jgi:hypothetical protein